MSSGLRMARIVVQVLAVVIALISVGLLAAAVLSSGWQIMIEPGTNEIHQHGLWLDYNHVRPHVAGASAQGPNHVDDPNNWKWIFNYKFGEAVRGDEVHRAQPYQETALILLAVAMCLGLFGTLVSYCAALRLFVAIIWCSLMFLTTILGAAALIQFYLTAMLPDHRYIFTDRRVEQVVGYSFWRAVGGTLGFGLVTLLSAVFIVMLVLQGRSHSQVKTEKAPFTFKRGGGGNNTQV